ncbi:MAG: methionyl-tRNA formyltransferase, partial [Desulfatitalea sp.]|nr:methionyl-tRNA formyltransferase [Desulfatitalea sp.]NNK01559.1 methionyl-tRNA formyltransferase [Desulfatitalea sp.]
MGTPEFAVPTLVALHEAHFNVLQVVTQPDRPKGRGRQPAPPPVKTAAQAKGHCVIQPDTVRTPEFAETLRRLAPDFLVVVAFGQILPVGILQIPKNGAVNVHASLLPRYRGPAPIQWAMIRGEHETGVTTMLMDSGVDTGDMLMQAKTAIHPDET